MSEFLTFICLQIYTLPQYLVPSFLIRISDDVPVGLLHEDFGRRPAIEEQGCDFHHLILRDLQLAKRLGKDEGWADQLHHISETGASTDRCKVCQRICLYLDSFRLAPDRENLHDFIKIIRQESDDKQTVEEIDGDTVR